MLVWRVESNGIGPYISHHWDMPYRTVKGVTNMSYAHGDRRHPSPRDDEGLDYTLADNEFCCFTSASALKEWFEGYGRVLDGAGYEVVVFQVDERYVRQGTFQSVFDKAQATPLLSFSTLTIIGG